MKQLIEELIRKIRGNLQQLKVEKMTLADRIKYEKALDELNTLSDMLYRSDIKLKDQN